MRRYFPINVSIEDADCLVVGGGNVALRKVKSLLDCGACVRVVAPEALAEFGELEGVELFLRRFKPGDVAGARIVFAATSDNDVNRSVYDTAHRRGILVNVVDVPPLCDFIVPSVLRRGPLTVTVSTSGAAPALARNLRRELERKFPESFGGYVALLGELRGEILGRVADPDRRRAIFERLAATETLARFEAEGPEAVRDMAKELWEE